MSSYICVLHCLHLIVFSPGHVCTASRQTLAFKVPDAVGAADIANIQQAQAQARTDFGDDEVTQRRQFGTDHEEAAGHSVVFLHGVLDEVAPHIRKHLSDLAFHIDEKAGWKVTQGLASYSINSGPNQIQQALTARCLEHISYKGGIQEDEPDSIGWHSDGATLMTMVIMLSEPSSFEGGDVHFMNEDGDEILHENYTLNSGDVLAWRGWTSHKAKPVISGHREVMVVEWWSGEDCAYSGVHRDADTVESIKHAITLDPTSSWLYKILGEKICKHSPCETDSDAQEAESAFRKAVSLAPKSGRRLRSLAKFFGGFQGYEYFQQACELERLQSSWAFTPCGISALSDSFINMLQAEGKDSFETQEEIDEAVMYVHLKYQTAKVAGGLVIAGGLWILVGKLEKYA